MGSHYYSQSPTRKGGAKLHKEGQAPRHQPDLAGSEAVAGGAPQSREKQEETSELLPAPTL